MLIFYGPTIPVDIGFDPNYKGAGIPISGIKDVKALVDTGATECCIDSLLAKQLNLPVVDRRPAEGIGGKKEVDIHLAQIHIPSLNRTVYGRFAGVHLAAGGQAHGALLGRTLLRAFTMTYNGTTGAVTLASPEVATHP
jgi:predicted aspartyl protease